MDSSFDKLSLSDALIAVVAELGYTQPTPIQTAAIPALLDGQDLVGQSKTGSGKTAAFGLPILQRIDIGKRAVQALILCPTRELVTQVAREIRKLGRGHPGLSVIELVGGQPARPQRDALGRGVHIAVGTPGRLLDHIKRKALVLEDLKTVVLDEADRMLDMGFGEEVGNILRVLPEARQTVLFSATFPESIEALTKSYQRNAKRVTIETPVEEFNDIRQLELVSDRRDKLHNLCWALHNFPHESALVFCNFKATVADLTGTLRDAGLSVDRLDGDLDQFHRDQVLARFRNQSVRILIATDVAGRGLDVKGLDLVINYELPSQPDIYVHRIGRTGRAGSQGVAISMTSGTGDSRLVAAEEVTGQKIETIEMASDRSQAQGSLMRSLAREPKMETILISGGRKDKIRPGDILGALTGKAGGLRGSDVGKIEVHERLAYVAVARLQAHEAVSRLNRGRIKSKKFRATLVAR
jgi:ATP-independent RNA helicase DbpA